MSAGSMTIARGAGWRWPAFFAGILIAWVALYAMAAGGGEPKALSGAGFRFVLCSAGDTGPASLILMWALMAAAMMAPSAVPMLKTYDDLTLAGAGSAAGFWALVGGYLAVWLGFAVVAGLAQWLLAAMDVVDRAGRSVSLWFDAGLLALAGVYQFTALRAACIERCRSPMMVFLAEWRPGAAGAAWMGIRHGIFCLGCCVGLMLLGFVGGTMNLAWMGLATVLMTLEKLPQIGRPISRPLGFLLLAAASGSAVTAGLY